jgi:hypothetical protein
VHGLRGSNGCTFDCAQERAFPWGTVRPMSRSTIHGQTGVISSDATPPALADAIELLWRDRDLYLAGRGGARARHHVDVGWNGRHLRGCPFSGCWVVIRLGQFVNLA